MAQNKKERRFRKGVWLVSAEDMRWSLIFFLCAGIITFFYLLLAWYVQGIDRELQMPFWWNEFLSAYPLFSSATPFVAFFVEMLSFDVLRHLLPLLAGGLLAYAVIIDFAKELYETEDFADTRRLLSRLMGNPEEPVVLNRLIFAEQKVESEVLRIGGPGRVNVTHGDAIVTEMNGKFMRVLGHGSHVLQRFEYVHAVIDLREQERRQDKVELLTREGLRLTTHVNVVFRVRLADRRPSRAHLFVFDHDAVRKVAYDLSLNEGNVRTRWDAKPINAVIGELKGIIGRKRLDELLDALPDSLNTPAHHALQQEMESNARVKLREQGIQLISARIGALVLDKELQETLIEYWKKFGEGAGGIEKPPQKQFDDEAIKKGRVRQQVIDQLAKGFAHLQDKGFVNATIPTLPPPMPTQTLIAAPQPDPTSILLVELIEKLARQQNGGTNRNIDRPPSKQGDTEFSAEE